MNAALPQIPLPEPSEIRIGVFALDVNPERWTPAGGSPAIRFRISFDRENRGPSIICHDPAKIEETAKIWFKGIQLRLLPHDAAGPGEPVISEDLLERAVLYRKCEKELGTSGMSPLASCEYMAALLKITDFEGIKKVMAVYVPLFRNCVTLAADAGVGEYKSFLFKDSVPQTKDEQRKDKCLTQFALHFGKTEFLHIHRQHIDKFLKVATKGQDMKNKCLYCLRGLFDWLRDYREVLPAGEETACDKIRGKKPAVILHDPYVVVDLTKLMESALLVDRELPLAQLLTAHHFVRQSEAVKMESKFFLRDPHGMPYEIVVPAHIAKTGEERNIPIPQRFQPLFQCLLPEKGLLFLSKDPFRRLDALARALGIEDQVNGYRRACVSYEVYAGMKRETAAKYAGHDSTTQKRYLRPVNQCDAKKYGNFVFDLAKVRQLPRHKKVSFTKLVQKLKEINTTALRLVEPLVSNPEAAAA